MVLMTLTVFLKIIYMHVPFLVTQGNTDFIPEFVLLLSSSPFGFRADKDVILDCS